MSIAAIREVKLVGRGGQGIVSAGEILARAIDADGRYAQSIPTFGPERRGGPAACSLRISDAPIRIKAQVTRFLELVCFDASIWQQIPVFSGLQAGGTLLLNSPHAACEVACVLQAASHLPSRPPVHLTLRCVDATGIALRRLRRPITSTAMLAAYAATSGAVSLERLVVTVREFFSDEADANEAVMRETVAALSEPVLCEGAP